MSTTPFHEYHSAAPATTKYKEGKDSDDLPLAIVDVAKHRNGPTGEVRLNFFSDYTRFDNRIEAPGADE